MKLKTLLLASSIFAVLLNFSGCQTTSPPSGTVSTKAEPPPIPTPEDFSVLPPTVEPASDLEDALPAETKANEVLFSSSQVEVRKELVQAGQVGDPLRYLLKIDVKEAINGLRVTETLPSNIRFISADPSPAVSEQEYLWTFGVLNPGATKEIAVVVQALSEGDHRICSAVSVDNRLCLPFFTGQPKLAVTKSGPKTIELNESGIWSVTVTNQGSAVARKVTVADSFPQGLQALSPVNQTIGDLDPKSSRTVEFSARAIQQGAFTNTAEANYQGSPAPATGSTPVTVVQSAIQITKSGPIQAYVFKPETFQIAVQNSGDTDLSNVRITDLLPVGTSIADNGGGRVKNNAIGWVIPSLPAGASQLITTRIAATQTGLTTNTVKLFTAQGLEATSSHQTEWLAVPGVTISITDSKDPIRVGESTAYTIRVRNQGDFEPVSGAVTLEFKDTLIPQTAAGDARGLIDGQTVTFPRTTLEPGKDINLRVTAKGAQIGPGRAVLSFTADFLSEPVINQETTNVY
ncbi:MAG: Large cysteine-rich periplasmic protein omcB [Opitutia bacterium UBA7350]|nr:MAG: Large cysteine-rich periplasmic protein omcB [Opitutae bacterium UBA7350]